ASRISMTSTPQSLTTEVERIIIVSKMSTIVTGAPGPTDSMDARLAARVLAEREQRGWSVAELAAKSGVSRAMISKIERAEASPAASLLVKIATAFGLPLSLLLARAEGEASRVSRADEQQRWQDPESGYRRRAISPPSDGLLQLTEVELPP